MTGGADDIAPPPPDLRLRSDPPPVMRLSRKALSILGLAGGAAIGGSLLYALQPTSKQPASELYNTESRSTADRLAGAPKDYGQIPKLGPPLPGDLGRPILSAQQRGVAVDPPPIGAAPSPPRAANPAVNAALAARQRAAQERDAARVSKLFLGNGAVGDGATVPGPMGLVPGPAPSGAAAPGANIEALPTTAVAADSDQSRKRAFLDAAVYRRSATTDQVQPVRSPYTLQAGSIIAAALITGIRSDLPGSITAQVTANVYDSPTGRLLLIPQGSRLIGEYDSQVSFGQNRVLLAWTRLILPDGSSVALERLPGADAAGFAGLQDRTDFHWGGIARAALLSTFLGVGAQVGGSADGDLVRAIRQGTSDTVSQTGQQIVRRQLNMQPTLTIRPGFPIRVVVPRDLVLAPVEQGEK